MYNKKTLIILIIITLLATITTYKKINKIEISEPINSYLAGKYMPNKFWLHRTNSVKKQIEFNDKYKWGVEFDIIFYEKEMAFENSHDKEDLIKYNLEKQFETYKNLYTNKGIWLDFKNLNEENKYEAKQVLNSLLRKYDISKEHIWLESSSWQSLDIFKKDGYKTSYYFPYYKFDEMTEKEIKKVEEDTVMIANSGNVNAISFAGKEYYDFVSGLDLPQNIILLTWLNDYYWYSILLNDKLNKIVEDDKVKVILVKDKGYYHR